MELTAMITAAGMLITALTGWYVAAKSNRQKEREYYQTDRALQTKERESIRKEFHDEISRLREDLAQRDEQNGRLYLEVQGLHSTLLQREGEIGELKQMLSSAQEQIATLTRDIEVLTERLK